MNRQLTMLIVDDMEVERISFAEIFKDEYQILEAENGKQAMEQLEQQKVHIVLLDLCMPVMDGFEVIRGDENSRISMRISRSSQKLQLMRKQRLKR